MKDKRAHILTTWSKPVYSLDRFSILYTLLHLSPRTDHCGSHICRLIFYSEAATRRQPHFSFSSKPPCSGIRVLPQTSNSHTNLPNPLTTPPNDHLARFCPALADSRGITTVSTSILGNFWPIFIKSTMFCSTTLTTDLE